VSFVVASCWKKRGRFALAWPFTVVDVVLGYPIDPKTTTDARSEIERALEHLDEQLAA